MSQLVELATYPTTWIRCIERFYGAGFLCPGGLTTCKEIVERLNVKAGDSVLDVGCGSGGMAFYLAEHVGTTVVAVDHSEAAVGLATERSKINGLAHKITFLAKDMRELEFEANRFDAISFWGSLCHVNNKDYIAMLTRAREWVKPGGRIVIEDLVQSELSDASPQEVQAYVTKMNFYPMKISGYNHSSKSKNNETSARETTNQVDMLSSVGLRLLEFEEHRQFYIDNSLETLAKIKENWDEIVKDVSKEALEKAVTFWEDKIYWARKGALYFCLYSCERPQEK